jgi:dTDP-L-rhamnose 4-epimerase
MGRVLVTGGAGFIGSHTVDRLKKLGYSVRILDSFAEPVHPKEHQLPNWLNSECEYVYGDVRSRECWQKVLKDIDAVIHLAAYQDYLPSFSTFFETNSVGTSLLYEVIAANKLPVKRVVVASSQAVYGEAAYFCSEHGIVYPTPRTTQQLQEQRWDPVCPICQAPRDKGFFYVKTDEHSVNPHNSYAISKHSQEQIALTLGLRYEIPSVALRYSIVQGPRQSFHNAYSGILRRFTLQLLNGRTPVIYEDGKQVRDYVSIRDVVDANVLALQDLRAEFEVFNVGGDRQITVNDYYQLLAAKLGGDPHNEPSGLYRFGDTRHVVSNVIKLKALGWEPKVSLEEIADEYIDWVKSQPLTGDETVEADEVMRNLGVVRKAA